MPKLSLDVKTCEYCISKNGGRAGSVPCQKAAAMSAPGLLVVPDSLITSGCPCRASWEDLKRAANRLPNRTGLSDWAAELLPLVKPAVRAQDAGYLAQGANNAHVFVTPGRKLVVWVQQIPDAAEAERFRNWFAGNGLQVPVAQLTTAQKLGASAWMALEEMPAEGAQVVRELIASIPVIVAVLGAIALSPAKYVRFFQCLFLGAGIVTQLLSYMESFAGWLAYAVNAQQTSDLRKAGQFLARFASLAIRDLGLVGIAKMISYLRANQTKPGALKRDAESGGYHDAEAAQAAPATAPAAAPGAQPVGALAEMPAKLKSRPAKTGTSPFSDMPEFRNTSYGKDFRPWLEANFSRVKTARLDADGFVDSHGGSEIWARRIPGTNLVECIRVDFVMKGGSPMGHNPPHLDGPVLRTQPRQNAKFAGNDPARHYGRMIRGEGAAAGTTLTTEQVAYGKVGHFHKETIRIDQLEQYCRTYVRTAKFTSDWGAPVPAAPPHRLVSGKTVFQGGGAKNNAAHIPLKP